MVAAHTKVRSALVSVEYGEMKVFLTSETASTTKITLISVENISSVNRVKNFTKLEPEVIDEMNNIPDVQIPVQAYNGRNGL